MGLLEAILLGIIQGLTEFLPVSSSGHIELGKAILGVEMKDPLLFSIVVHGATALSTIVIFRKDIAGIFADLLKFQWNEGTRFASMIVLSMIPVGIVGVLFEDQIEAFFDGQILLVGCTLLLTGILLYLTTKAAEQQKKVTHKSALIIGLSQAIAILPGISRSGSTIATALLLGINKEKAARFSFLMVLPPIMGALLIKLKKYVGGDPADVVGSDLSTMVLAVGFLAAFLSGLAACKWMIKIVKQSKLQYFAYYCFVVGTIAIVWQLTQ